MINTLNKSLRPSLSEFILPSYERLIKRLPPKYAAYLDFRLRPSLKDPLGGPFNGQLKRQEMFLEIINKISLNMIVETGTFRGTTTEFFAAQQKSTVYTIESNPYNYHYSLRRLRHLKNVKNFLGDSRQLLTDLSTKSSVPKERVLFYLDAHWYEDLPLREEVAIILKAWTNSLIIIDDFQVPNDPGYGYDDYGEGKCLCLEYLQTMDIQNLEVFWPSAPSILETGARRGCVLLVTRDDVSKKLSNLTVVRKNSF